MKSGVDSMDIKAKTDNPFPEPFRSTLGKAEWRGLSDYFGLTQFGANLEILYPNAQSALRHWHTESDEFVFILEGTLVLITNDGEMELTSGMCAGFKAGEPNGHHLVNRTTNIAKFLVIGTRIKGDKVHYPDDDFQWIIDEDGTWKAARKNGSKY